jgi:hypothetical protein
MGVSICKDAWDQVACMYDNTTGEAFGPVFTGPAAGEGAEAFLTWLAENGQHAKSKISALLTLETDRLNAGTDPRDWAPVSLRVIAAHFQATVLDTVVGHAVEARIIPSARPEDEELLGEIDPTGKGFEPDGQRLEGGRIVPTDR